MAIAKMRKVQILIHQDAQDRLMERIQKLGQLHITDIRDGITVEQHPDLVLGTETADEGLERRLSQIQSTLDFLSSVRQKKGLFSGLISPKIILTPHQYEKVVNQYIEEATVSRCRELERERTELLSSITKLEGITQQLVPWLALDCSLEEVTTTDHTALYLGTLPVDALEAFHRGCAEIADRMAVETVNTEGETAYLLICCHHEVSAQVRNLVKHLGFEEASFPGLEGKPENLYQETRRKIDQTRRRVYEIEETSREYLGERQNLQVLYDHFHDQLQRRRVEALFGRTEVIVVIEGWIPARQVDTFEASLREEFDEVVILPIEASAKEEPPIVLQNSETFVRPFEVVTELYGLPNTKEFDPSPLLAPFFFVFFGLCLTDAAYGIIITLLFLFLMKKYRVTFGRAKLVGLLFFGGISTIFMGTITGGWFGNLSEYLPPWLDGFRRMREALMLFDPMEQVLVFIGIALILGFIQICYGLVIRVIRRIRDGDLAEAFFGPFPWLTLLNGVILFGVSQRGVVSSSLGGVGKWMAIVSALVIVLFTDRTSPSWFARIAWGVYGLYGITSYVGDVLSYLRLFALGLATGIIAMVVNLLADMLGGAPYIGGVLFVIVFVIGHIFNILINGLGAFVHTLRLQYVEFFPKFFEGGGTPYRPFQKEARYTIVAESGYTAKT